MFRKFEIKWLPDPRRCILVMESDSRRIYRRDVQFSPDSKALIDPLPHLKAIYHQIGQMLHDIEFRGWEGMKAKEGALFKLPERRIEIKWETLLNTIGIYPQNETSGEPSAPRMHGSMIKVT